MSGDIATGGEAEKLLDELAGVIDLLSGVVEQETALIRAGQVRKAAALEPSKAELAGRLVACGERLKANAALVLQAAPARCAALHGLQDKFHALLQRNLIVVATSHAVSEGIVRQLSGELAHKTAPQVYGASGKKAVPGPKRGQPLAVSRVS